MPQKSVELSCEVTCQLLDSLASSVGFRDEGQLLVSLKFFAPYAPSPEPDGWQPLPEHLESVDADAAALLSILDADPVGQDAPCTIVRATQFFEFLRGIAESGADGSVVRVSDAPMQPLAAMWP